MKKTLKIIGILAAVVVVSFAFLMFKTFGGLSKMSPETLAAHGVVSVADGFVQAFIIPDGQGGAVLVDCTADAEAKTLKAKLQELNLSVTAILVTHGHGDHVAGCQTFPEAPLYALESEKDLVEGTGSPKGPMTKLGQNDASKMHKLTTALRDGETLDLGGLQVQVFAIPGHTSGSAAFLAKDVLFLGDSVAADSSGKLRDAPWLFSDDAIECAKSVKGLAKKLENVPVKALAFSHSGALNGKGALLSYAQEP